MNDSNVGSAVDAFLFPEPYVARQARYAMGINPSQIGHQQNFGG
jgi:hypothetical protein